MNNCMTGCKYCIFGCALECISPCDGCYNCFMIIQLTCGDGLKTFGDMTKNTEFIAGKIKEGLGLETGNEPMKSYGTFEP